MIDYVVILAGGSGTRLWPASTSAKPKQFFSLYGDESLLEISLHRADALHPSGGIVIVTLETQIEALISLLGDISLPRRPLYILPEPRARNTAPAIAAATLWAQSRFPGGSPVIFVMTADHLITPVESFAADALKAAELAGENNMVTFGIAPSRPETGYGYIEVGSVLDPGYRVKSFREKPDLDTAKRFLEYGNFLWNSGMFCFSAPFFMDELSKHTPDVYDRLADMKGRLPPDEEMDGYTLIMRGEELDAVYEKTPGISVDYAVMEKCTRSAVVRASFHWNDIGSWDVVADLLEGKSGKAPVFSVSSEGNFVYADIPVALCGVDDLIVVVQNGVVLICRKGGSQQVKDVLADVKNSGREELI